MHPTLKDMLPAIERWPAEDQETLAEFARELEAARTGFYATTPAEDAAIAEGLMQADRGEFAPANEMAALAQRG